MNSKISIIIPAFKAEKYIGQCLNSVLNQTYSNLEVIAVVDSKSNDKTEEIVRTYEKKDSRIKVILQHGKKQGEARNGGIDEATGDYILFLDADDWLSTECCEEALKTAEGSEADIVFFDFFKEFEKKSIPIFTYKQEKLIYSNARKEFSIYNMHFVTPWGKLYSRDIIKNERFDINVKEAEDVEFNFRLYSRISFAIYIHKNLYHYRIQTNSAIHGFDENKLIKFDYTINKIKKITLGKGEEKEHAYYSFLAIVYIVLCQNSIYLNPKIGLVEKIKRIASLENREYFNDMFFYIDKVELPFSRKIIPFFGKKHIFWGIIFVLWVKQLIDLMRK